MGRLKSQERKSIENMSNESYQEMQFFQGDFDDDVNNQGSELQE